MLLVSATIAFSGFGQSFWQGQYPLIVANKDEQVPLPLTFSPRSISYLMMTVCGGEVVGCLALGKLSDYTLRTGRGRRPVILVAAAVQALAYLLIYLTMMRQVIAPVPALAFSYGFLLGFADSAFNHQVSKGPEAVSFGLVPSHAQTHNRTRIRANFHTPI